MERRKRSRNKVIIILILKSTSPNHYNQIISFYDIIQIVMSHSFSLEGIIFSLYYFLLGSYSQHDTVNDYACSSLQNQRANLSQRPHRQLKPNDTTALFFEVIQAPSYIVYKLIFRNHVTGFKPNDFGHFSAAVIMLIPIS